MTTQATRVLPANVFDALELSALIHGGIGASCLTKMAVAGVDEYGDRDYAAVPHCIVGHAMFLDGYDLDDDREHNIVPDKSPVVDALVKAFPDLALCADATYEFTYRDFITEIEGENDSKVVGALRLAGDQPEVARITFKTWCRKLRVVRGEN